MYRVTIKREGSLVVARDENGSWRAKGDACKAPLPGLDLAEYLFHKVEIDSVTVNDNGDTIATIKEWSNGKVT